LLSWPDVDSIDGLSPAIAIDQKGGTRNPRSTVGTVTEIYDFLRLLFARVGRPHCPHDGRPLERQTAQQMVDAILGLPDGTRLLLLAPVVREKKGEHQKVFEDARKGGFVRVRVNGDVRELDEEIKLEKYRLHTIEVVVDRLVIRHTTTDGRRPTTKAQSSVVAGRSSVVDHPDRIRVADSVETALKVGAGVPFPSLRRIETFSWRNGMPTLVENSEAVAVDAACSDDALTVVLDDGRTVSVPLVWFPRLLSATSEQRKEWEPIGGGIGLHWEAIDEDISIASLLQPERFMRLAPTLQPPSRARNGWSAGAILDTYVWLPVGKAAFGHSYVTAVTSLMGESFRLGPDQANLRPRGRNRLRI
jgi:hypothetical protein